MKKFLLLLVGACAMAACSSPKQQVADYNVVPLPHSIEAKSNDAAFALSKSTKIAVANDSLMKEAEFLQEYIRNLTGYELKIDNEAKENVIVLSADLSNENPEAYQINVDADKISVNGATSAGTFYGVQTLRKAIPEQIKGSQIDFPAATITDMPRFGYRGALLDVARHPMEVDSVKSFIDMLALHNINHMHWHITDDQGWRIEIKKYPKLTEIGSHRDGTMFERNWDQFDTIPVDGFYTQEEARDIVDYAAKRHITIVPEIDLPGHMVAALTAYPHLGCTGGPYEVWQKWGISEDVLCAGNDSVYTFIDDVLNELVDIFPSEYIHIGGDECPKVRWKECPKCQAKMKELKLVSDDKGSAEAKLQNHIMSHAQKTLAQRGRKTIGWDEILEGGAPDDVVIMSWRGEQGAHTAAKAGHDAILTPNTYLYFDYCQSLDQDSEPVSIGGYIPVEKVYGYEPIPADFTEEEAAHILGVQANLWREYIKTLSHAQYMELPRMAALSEVQWVQPGRKDYPDFIKRLQNLINHYNALGYNYARHIYDIKGEFNSNAADSTVTLTLSTVIEQPIYYTTNGTMPTEESTLYTEPIKINQGDTIKAITIAADGRPGHLFTGNTRLSKSTLKPYTLADEPADKFKGNPGALTDGILGLKAFAQPEWVGIQIKDLVATIDLGAPTEISEVTMQFNVDTASWVFDTRGIKVEVSDNCTDFKEVASEQYEPATAHSKGIVDHKLTFAPVKAQYVRVTALTEKAMPLWHNAPGKFAFLFCDEIAIN